MLWNVNDVVTRTQNLLDDPTGSEFDNDYLMPFLNQRWDDISTELSMLGLDYEEVRLCIGQIAASTPNLDAYMADGQPLASLMFPKRVEWKLVGSDDTMYQDATLVDDLDDFPAGTVGILEYSWTGGQVLLVPSSVPVIVRITFTAMSVTLVDPDDKTIRGVTNIIAYKVAALIWKIRGNDALATDLEQKGEDALDTFERAAVMRDQAKLRRVPPMHPRYTAGGLFIVSTNNQ